MGRSGVIQGAAFRVLATFHDQDSGSFADICERAGYPTDLGGYYLRQLVGGEYLLKQARGTYSLTAKGKQELAFHYGKHFFTPRPRLAVALIARQAGHFLVLQRKVQPFLNATEWPAGTVNLGESVPDAAKRIALTRLGQAPELTLHGFFRRIDTYEGTVFDDKLFAVHSCSLPADTEIHTSAGTGDIAIRTRNELDALEKPSRSLLDILAFTEQSITYNEHSYQLITSDF